MILLLISLRVVEIVSLMTSFGSYLVDRSADAAFFIGLAIIAQLIFIELKKEWEAKQEAKGDS